MARLAAAYTPHRLWVVIKILSLTKFKAGSLLLSSQLGLNLGLEKCEHINIVSNNSSPIPRMTFILRMNPPLKCLPEETQGCQRICYLFQPTPEDSVPISQSQ